MWTEDILWPSSNVILNSMLAKKVFMTDRGMGNFYIIIIIIHAGTIIALSAFRTVRYKTLCGIVIKIVELTCVVMQAVLPDALYPLGRRHVLTLRWWKMGIYNPNPACKASCQRFMCRSAPSLILKQGSLPPASQARPKTARSSGPKGMLHRTPLSCLWRKVLTAVERHSECSVKNGHFCLLGLLHSQFHNTLLHLCLENSFWNCTFTIFTKGI